ncbi:MAG TPA: membrane dipeptidase [Candidatus Limnocylindrales bacterium]|nr:membrane dipeptidase [Candidatus Limnocylindrales bacterium]
MTETNSRRTFLVTLGRVLLLAELAPRVFADTATQFSPEIAELYRKSIVIDTLCSPFASDEGLPDAAAIESVRRSGITAINFTVSAPTFEGTIDNLAYVDALVEQSPDVFTVIRQYSDITRAKTEAKIGIMPGFQYTGFLEADPSRIETFRQLGIRIMQLTYNNRSAFGDGCLEPGNAGLSKAGHAAVRKMNEIGVAIDLSHSGYRTTSEAIEASAKPVLITHSGCAAVYAHPRSKPDEILKALADRGGYFGVYLMPYLVASPTVPTREHVLDHLVHAINVCGADHVGIGSDGSIQGVRLTTEQQKAFAEDIARRKKLGIGAPGEDRYPYVPDLSGPDHMEIIVAELKKRGQPGSVVEKVLGANFQRVIGEIWSTK